MCYNNGDIILSSPWMDKMGTIILNMKKKFLTIRYKKKKITLQDFSILSDSKAPSSEDFKDISKMILQDNQKSVQKMQKEAEKIITNKDKVLS